MIPVLSREESRAFDAHAIDVARVPALVLMENAGRGATDVLVRDLLGGAARGARVVVVAGVGNNGGDGFVVARHLVVRGATVDVFRVGDVAKLGADARANHDALAGIGVSVRSLDAARLDELRGALDGAAAVVDALFGTGLDRPLGELHAAIVGALNAGRAPRFAVDVPSGLDADTGAALGTAVRADVTATFAHPKRGLLTPHGADLSGRVTVVDIGVPSRTGDGAGNGRDAVHLLERADVAGWIRPRLHDAHKHAVGHVVVFAGSAGKIGAALLVAKGAMAAGAGAVTIATWEDAADRLESRVLEAMTARLSRADLAGSVAAAIAGKHAAVIGPGFGTDAAARAVLEQVVRGLRAPVVVDADALTMCAASPDLLGAAAAAIVTPHDGEAARLLGTTARDIEADRFSAARALTERTRAVAVLKGAFTLVAAPGRPTTVNPSGNAALATAGAGDVLAGIVAALACTLPPDDAARAGAYLHGAAADDWRRATGADRGLVASRIASRVPHVVGALTREHAARTRGHAPPRAT